MASASGTDVSPMAETKRALVREQGLLCVGMGILLLVLPLASHKSAHGHHAIALVLCIKSLLVGMQTHSRHVRT